MEISCKLLHQKEIVFEFRDDVLHKLWWPECASVWFEAFWTVHYQAYKNADERHGTEKQMKFITAKYKVMQLRKKKQSSANMCETIRFTTTQERGHFSENISLLVS